MKFSFFKIAVTFIMVCLTYPLFAQTTTQTSLDSLPSYRMSEIVILGEKIPEATTATVSEITKKEIHMLDVRNAREAMEFAPGIYFSRTGKNETGFRLRGFEQRQVSVFLDGVPISVPYDGLMDISQIAGDNIENIRVSKGVSSVLYGANTLGGSVNIITGVPRQGRSLDFRMEGSSQGRFYSGLGYSGSSGKLRYITAFSLENAPNFQLPQNSGAMRNENGGARDNSAFRKSNIAVKLHYDLNAAHHLGLHVNSIMNRFNVPPDALAERPRYWQFPDWQKNVISLNSEHILSGNFILRSVWYYDQYKNRLESYDDATYSSQTRGYAFTSIYDDYSLGGILYPEWNGLHFGTTRGVISFKRDTHREKAAESAPYHRYQMEIWTAGIEQEIKFSSRLQASAGLDANYLRPVYANQSPLRDPIMLINGQAALRYQIAGKWSVHAAVGQKSRFPTLKELYSERLGRNLANPQLKAEHSLNFEMGTSWAGTGGHFNISGFYNHLNDLIVNRQLGNNTQQYQNIGKAGMWGVEAGYQGQWRKITGYLNYTYLRAKNLSSGRDSDHLEYRPSHRVNGILTYTLTQWLNLNAELSYTAWQYYQNSDDGAWGRLNDFLLLNLKAGYKINRIAGIYLRVNNLTDKFYYSEYGVPMPGREFIAGMRLGI